MRSLDSSQGEGTRGAPDSVEPSGAGEIFIVAPLPAVSTANPGQPLPPRQPPPASASATEQFASETGDFFQGCDFTPWEQMALPTALALERFTGRE